MLRLSRFGRFRAADALGNEISIKSKKARALLAYLALPPGKERSREEVMALLWSERGDEQARSSLRQALSGLRKELGESAVGAVKVTDEWLALDPALVAVEPASPGDVLLAGLHISDPAFEEWLRDERLRQKDIAPSDTTPTGPPLPDNPSIAVLPFVNLSGDADQEYFSDGITEDIITELSRYRSLFVIARNSSFAFKDRAVTVQEIGEDLGISHVVEGSVRRSGSRVRVTAQLVETASGNHLWAERYDRELDDIFAVQDEVTRSVVSILAAKLDYDALLRARRKPTVNLSAYDYLLRGEWYERKSFFDPKALDMWEKAVAIDPACARAHGRMANFYLYDVFVTGMQSEETVQRAQELAEKALSIDEDDGHIQSAAAIAYLLVGRHDLAKAHSERALALNPNDVYVIYCYGLVMTYLGDPDVGLEWYRLRQRLDPYELEAAFEDWIEAYYMSRQYEMAIDTFDRWRAPPFHLYPVVAACYAQIGRRDEARAAAAQYESERPKSHDLAGAVAAHLRMCARPEDRDHWLEGYRKAGFAV